MAITFGDNQYGKAEVRLVHITRDGDRHQIKLSPDHAFIVGCSGTDACACAVDFVELRDAGGMVLSTTKWLAPRCWRLP